MTAPDPRLDEIQARAEKFVAAYTRMIELDGGIGLLYVEAPEMYADWEAWDDASRVQHADTALFLLAELRKAHEALAAVETLERRWATLADGDRYYARRIREAMSAAVAAATGDGE